MSTQKPLCKYSSKYKELFRTASRKGIAILTLPNELAAQTMRKELYNYRLALREDKVCPPTEELVALVQIANALTFKIRGSKLILAINTSVYDAIIARALEEMT